MSLTKAQRQVSDDMRQDLIRRGLSPSSAAAIVHRAVGRVSPCCGSCRGGGRCGGLGDVVPTQPVAIAGTASGAPAILANIASAGDDPSVVAARNAVTKWSFLIPIGGLLMSAKNKISEWRSPLSAAMVGSKRRR